jgi:UDP-N-acetylmuramoyl-tripeptide--D-alanyl-D-alanine ligase
MHLHWCKSNIGKLIFRSVLSLCGLLVLTEPLILQVFAAIVLAFSIFLLIPKKKSKVPFKITGRVLRLFALEAVITALIIFIKPSLNCTIIRLGIINVLAPFLCLAANFVLYPIEKVGQKHYIDSAKAILEKHQDLTIIGITGSYGKTSMKTFLTELLKQKYNVLTTPQNYNTPLCIARTIKTELKPTHQIFVCEMGAMWKGEIAECCELANPDLGIITAIGPQHLQTFKTIDTIISTKFELADSVAKNDGVVFLDYDNQYIKKHHTKANVISYGVENEKLDYYADKLKSSSEGQRFTINHEGKKLEC